MSTPEEARAQHRARRAGGVTLSVPGRPISWARTATVPVPGGGTKRVTPTTYRRWKQRAVQALSLGTGHRYAEEVELTIDVRADGVTVNVKPITPAARIRPRGLRGDLDNYAKAIIDALQAAGVVADDRQVVSIDVRFWPDPTPTLTPTEEPNP